MAATWEADVAPRASPAFRASLATCSTSSRRRLAVWSTSISDPAAVAAANTHWERQLGIIAAELRARPGSDFLLGDRLTAVDIVLVDNVCSAAGYGWLPLAPHPQAEDGLTVLRYLRRLAERPAFVRAQARGAFDLAAVTELADKAGQALDGQ